MHGIGFESFFNPTLYQVEKFHTQPNTYVELTQPTRVMLGWAIGLCLDAFMHCTKLGFHKLFKHFSIHYYNLQNMPKLYSKFLISSKPNLKIPKWIKLEKLK